MDFNQREINTILAALRFLANVATEDDKGKIEDVATNSYQDKIMTSDEINDLADRFICDD